MTDSDLRNALAGNIKAINTGLPQGPKQLFEWAVLGNGTLYTAQIPVGPDGAVVAGGIEKQAQQVFGNLLQTLAAAGASHRDVAQIPDLRDRSGLVASGQRGLSAVFLGALPKSGVVRRGWARA
jgi:hypothetical protein